MRGMRNRRGSTMILVGVSMIVLVGVMAFSLDFGRMYLFRSQVHVSSDAAALAGAKGLMDAQFGMASYDVADDSAVAYGQINRVESAEPTITTDSVVPGVWDFGARSFTPAGSWSAAGNNAVRATSYYTASYTFGRIFGLTTRVRSATSIAAVGYVGATDCVRPLAMPYQVLLDVLYPPAGTMSALTYNLSAADIESLKTMTIANNLAMQGGNVSSIVSGNYYGVRLPPILYADGTRGDPWSGAKKYEEALSATCEELNEKIGTDPPYIGPGDWLDGENGVMTGPTSKGVGDLCVANGGTTPANPGSNSTFSCNVPVQVKVAIWAESGSPVGGCGGKCFRVKYIGEFAITGFVKHQGVTGYFLGLPSSGTFTPNPSPLKKIALVQ